MSTWRIRDFQPTDMDALLRLWEQHRGSGTEPVYGLSEVIASTRKDTAVVAVAGEKIVGVAVARAAHDQGWIVFFATDDEWRRRGIGGALLASLEQRMAQHGLQKLTILVPDEQTQVGALTKAGFADKRHLRYFEREIRVKQQEMVALRELGGRILPSDRWDAIGGMQHEKDVLERRLVLPLSDPDLAEEYGVVPPRAIVLFGPPGTGKTTFAKGIASASAGRLSRSSRRASRRRRVGLPVSFVRPSSRSSRLSTRSCSSTRSKRSPRTGVGSPRRPRRVSRTSS